MNTKNANFLILFYLDVGNKSRIILPVYILSLENEMLSHKNKFVHKKIGEVKKYSQYGDIMKTGNKKNTIINIFITIFCILIIGYFGKYLIQAGHIVATTVSKSTVSLVSKSLGKEMIKDEFWNINIMIIWYGWEKHSGAFLADSNIIASRNPKLGAVTMLSVPRDLVVYNKEEWVLGRINQLFSRGVGRAREYNTGAKVMIDQLEKITGLKIPYYVLIDFKWFEKVINTLWWVKIDVPKSITDTTYPLDEQRIMTFHVNSGFNTFDGKTALMYARSRHSTSDFDRSLRQQQIVKAVVDALIAQGMNPSKMKSLYNDYTEMVRTNISMDEMIGLGQYAYNLKHIFSYGFTTECSNITYKYSYPGCFLYTPSRELFGGASVILPIGADNKNPTYYQYTQNFAFYVVHNQEYLIENPKIVIRNGIDKKYAKKMKMKTDGYANQLAVKLKKYAFTITTTKNAPQPNSGTILYILGTWSYDMTINTLKSFVPINQVVDVQNDTTIQTWVLEKLQNEQNSWATLVLMMGNQYLDTLQGKKFDYYK